MLFMLDRLKLVLELKSLFLLEGENKKIAGSSLFSIVADAPELVVIVDEQQRANPVHPVFMTLLLWQWRHRRISMTIESILPQQRHMRHYQIAITRSSKLRLRKMACRFK